MKRLNLLVTAVVVFSSMSIGQNSKPAWSYSLYLGASNMLSDLGGGNTSNTFPLSDIDLRATRPAIGAGIQRHWSFFSLDVSAMATHLVADDAFTSNQGRAVRNLCVRTGLIEASLMTELRPFYKIQGLNRLYFAGGVGGMYYQPKAKYDNTWYKLRELGTEGQNVAGTPYKKFGLIVPVGVGYKFPFGRNATLNLDVTLRKTYTDYLDDVSTVYFDAAAIAETSGEIAGILSDRSLNGLTPGNQRGNPNNNDSYFTVGFKYQKTFGKAATSCYFDEVPKKNRRRIKRHQQRMF
jgi:hypothetical protein